MTKECRSLNDSRTCGGRRVACKPFRIAAGMAATTESSRSAKTFPLFTRLQAPLLDFL